MHHRLLATCLCAWLAVLLFTTSASPLQAQSPEPTLAPMPTETPPPFPTLPPQTIRPIEPVSTLQTDATLVMLSAVLLPILLIALLALLGWLWLRQRAAHPEGTPYLEHLATGKKFHLTRETQMLGRASDCQLKIAKNLAGADTLSLRHARLFQHGTRWLVADGERDELPSLNGITVNGKRTLENYLNDGDVITFGEMQFRFHQPAPHAPGETR